VFGCAYCHLPTGSGRPENAMLAGLPAAYIERQLADLKTGVRRSAWGEPYRPNSSMRTVAESASTAEVAQAARYFSRLRRVARTRVVERTVVPRLESELGLFFADSAGGTEPLGRRLVLVPTDAERHERRDPTVDYIAYVPPGSLVRGRKIAMSGVRAGAKSCISCHGLGLRGVGVVPPIAGQSPSYILRQLFAFKTGARASPTGALMREVTASLELDDMIAVAAYAGSRKP
jgi:cytochrome c553